MAAPSGGRGFSLAGWGPGRRAGPEAAHAARLLSSITPPVAVAASPRARRRADRGPAPHGRAAGRVQEETRLRRQGQRDQPDRAVRGRAGHRRHHHRRGPRRVTLQEPGTASPPTTAPRPSRCPPGSGRFTGSGSSPAPSSPARSTPPTSGPATRDSKGRPARPTWPARPPYVVWRGGSVPSRPRWCWAGFCPRPAWRPDRRDPVTKRV